MSPTAITVLVLIAFIVGLVIGWFARKDYDDFHLV